MDLSLRNARCYASAMRYEITEHGEYVRAVIGENADAVEFERFYRELQALCAVRGIDRAMVVVRPEGAVAGPDRLHLFGSAGFLDGFKLALVCATWTLYQACNKAERTARKAAVTVRAFLQEMEAARWLTGTDK